jgi:hypothetical protein
MAHLSIDDGAFLLGRVRPVAQRHQLERRQDRCQRIPQLVSPASPGTRPSPGSRLRHRAWRLPPR